MARTVSNAQRIERLRAAGWTDAAIGRALGGRDHSFIRQVRLGKKPGSTITAGLRQLERRPAPARGAKVRPVKAAASRRTTSTGLPARVRLPVLQFPSGLTIAEVRSPRASTIRRALLAAQRRGQRVVITATFRNVKGYGGSGRYASTAGGVAGPVPKGEERGQVRIGARREGIDPGELLARIDRDGGNAGPVIRELARAEPGIEKATGLVGIKITTYG